jgi:hypothetical protein
VRPLGWPEGRLKASGRQAHHKAMAREDLPEFLRALSAYDGAARTRLALRLALLTLVRTTELRAVRWGKVDLEAAEWRIPADAACAAPRKCVTMRYGASWTYPATISITSPAGCSEICCSAKRALWACSRSRSKKTAPYWSTG